MEFELKIIEEHKHERYLLLHQNGGTYQVSALLYQVLLQYKGGKSYQDIAVAMNEKHNATSFDDAFIKRTVTNALYSSEQEVASAGKEQHYVAGRIPVIKEGRLLWLYKILSVFFQQQLFPVLFCFSAAVTGLFLYNSGLLSFANLWNRSVTHLSVGDTVTVYFLFMCIVLLHELGHATASYTFGVKPKEIGFGWYFIFPVLYANVSDIWQLPASRRNVVNIAGVYFQLLVNVILISCYYNNISQPLLCTLIISNTISMVCSLIPFFRYDGYWLFSDYFNIPNLKAKSASLAAGVLLGGVGKWRQIKGSLPLALHFYTLASVVFWLFVYAEVARLIVLNSRLLLGNLQQGGWLYITITPEGLFSAVFTVISLWVLIIHSIQLYKLLGYERQKISGTKKPYSHWNIA